MYNTGAECLIAVRIVHCYRPTMNQTKKPATNPQRVVIYCRVSTSMQANDGHSLDQQSAACKQYVQSRRSSLHEQCGIDVRFETTSGSIEFAKREAGKEIIESLRDGDWLVCSRLDRAFRSAKDCLWVVDTLKKRNVQVHLLDLRMGDDGCVTNGIGHMFMTIMSAVAQFEREKIGERTRDVKQKRLAEGYFVGGKVKWGMRVVDGRFEVDKRKQKLIAEMKKWRRAGVPLRDIRDRLVQRGEAISVDTVRKLTLEVTSDKFRKRGRRRKAA